MKNTKLNVIELLEQMRSNAHDCANYAENINSEHAKTLRYQALAYSECINLLTDSKYFNDIWEIYND